MEFKNMRTSIISLIVIVNLFGLSYQDEHPSYTTPYEFDIEDEDVVKRTFKDWTKMDNVWLIFFNITLLPNPFIKNTKVDKRHVNDLTRWIWVPRKHSYLLTYPVDLAAITFGISQKVERTISFSVKVNDKNNSHNYTMCLESLFGTIFEKLLKGRKTDWLFCHRYFEGQSYKYVLCALTGSWIGYDFACFDRLHHTETSATYIQKGTVNVFIDIFIIVLLSYFPLLFLLLPDRYNTQQNEVLFYRKSDYPYSFARLILGLHDTHILKEIEVNSFKEWYARFDINRFKPEIHIFSFLYIVTIVIYIFEDQFSKQKIPDYRYAPENFNSWLTSTNIYINVSILTISYFIAIPLCIVAMSYFTESNSKYLSVNPFGLVKINDVWKLVKQTEKLYVGYTKFAKKFFHRISLFFSLDLWAVAFEFPCTDDGKLASLCNVVLVLFAFFPNFCLYLFLLLVPNIYFLFDFTFVFPYKIIKHHFEAKIINNKALYVFLSIIFSIFFWICIIMFFLPTILFVIQFIFRSIVYVMFVAGPLFASISDTTYSFWTVISSVAIYLVIYTTSFHMNYKKLLDLLFQINRDHQNRQQNSINSEGRSEKISVHDFDKIADKYIPFRHQMLYLFLKLTLTGSFLFVTLNSINQGENNKFATVLLPSIIAVAIPALAGKLCSQSNFDETLNVHKDEIKFDFLEGKTNNHDNIPITKSTKTMSGKKTKLILTFPVVYSALVLVCFIFNSICRRPSPKTVQQCPPECSRFCIRKRFGICESFCIHKKKYAPLKTV